MPTPPTPPTPRFPPLDGATGNFMSRARLSLFSALGLAPRAPAHEARLDECMDGADRDESFAFADVTQDTLVDMRQENAHSLERDASDPFFWNHARPDSAAGMAKVYLCARCPTPYWRALVGSNSYALWGAVAMARMEALNNGESCAPSHLGRSSLAGVAAQARMFQERAGVPFHPQFRRDLDRAEGLAIHSTYLGDAHKHSALRALFAGVLLGKPIHWPDLPARLLGHGEVPARLPGLEIDLSNLSSKPAMVDRAEAEAFWISSFQAESNHLLLVPDWASWMLAPGVPAPFAKTPTLS